MLWLRLTILVVDATLWPTRPLHYSLQVYGFPKRLSAPDLRLSGQISIDEAIQLCASVSSGNTSSVAFFCMPQCHSSTKRDSVLKNRRLLEDKVGACPVCKKKHETNYLSRSRSHLHVKLVSCHCLPGAWMFSSSRSTTLMPSMGGTKERLRNNAPFMHMGCHVSFCVFFESLYCSGIQQLQKASST